MPRLGVVVYCLPGMKHLEQCLESVQWADVIAVLYTGEGEPLLGGEPRSSLILRKFVSTEEVKHLAQEIRTDWVLQLWGEERVEEELRKELRALCQTGLNHAPFGYQIPIRSLVLGRWVEGSLFGPTPALRLSRGVEEISSGWWSETTTGVREAPGLPGGWIGDYSAVELSDAVEGVRRISDFWAQQLQAREQDLSLASMVLCPLRVFFRLLVKNGVFAKGLAGLTLSILAAYAALVSSAKVWEARNVKSIAK